MPFPAISPSLVDSGCKNKNQAKREKRRPPGTVEFIVSKATPGRLPHFQGLAACLNGFCPLTQVGPNDSLSSIALKFNITPNKLVQLNKLFSRSVYPGQVGSPAAPSARRCGVLRPADSRCLYRSCLSLTVTSQSRSTRVPPSPMAAQTACPLYVLKLLQTGFVDGHQFSF